MSKRSEKDNAVRYRMKGERRAALLEIIDSQPFTSLHELEAAFPGVSGMTIRRDLDTFEEQGRIIKSRGGAKSMKFVMNAAEENFSERLRTNKGAKDLISRRAVEFIEPGRSIFFDSGTTMLRVAELLSDRRITVTTSGLNVALELMKKEHVMVNIDHMANTSGGTLPLCLWEYEPQLKKGDKLVFTAFGAGFTWGASYMIWGYDGAKEAAKEPAQFFKEGLMTREEWRKLRMKNEK